MNKVQQLEPFRVISQAVGRFNVQGKTCLIPEMNRIGCHLMVPYIDVSYEGSFQPGREAALRTFMYQAYQHFNSHGRP